MNLADKRLTQLDDPKLSADDRAKRRCQVAADFIHTGQYEMAREALGELWRGVGERPNVKGLDKQTAAEILLQVGALSGWLGASGQMTGVQAQAKDLISESTALFDRLGEFNRAATARSELALCYWREGAYDEAHVMLDEAYSRATDGEQKVKIAIRFAVVESAAGRYNDALCLLTESASLLEDSTKHALRGSVHNELAIVLRRLGTAEQREDYFDRAIIEYTAAVFHYEQAGHERYSAAIENNLAFLLYKLGRYQQAHEHLDRAGVTLVRLGDAGLLAQVDETRARVLIAEQRYREANKAVGRAVQTLERGGESALLAEAYTSQGIVWARLGSYQNSLNILRRAVSLAQESGALSNAGPAVLTLIEEHGALRLPEVELVSLYLRADELLRGTQDVEDVARLRDCARIVIKKLSGVRLSDRNFSLYGAVHDLEARFIGQALEASGGSVTKAARVLGISHQSLTLMLETRHKKLLSKRTPAKKRFKSIIQKPE